MKTRLLLALTLAGTLLSTHAFAQTTWTIDPNHSSVNFEVVHLGVSHVHGFLGGVNGTVVYNDKDLAKSSVTAAIETKTVSTGVERRDADLKSPNFFDIEKFPTITFKSTSLSKSNGKQQLIGELTLNGVTKSVTLDLDGPAPPQENQGKTVSAFSASGKLSRKDFGFGSKTATAIVSDEVKFSIDVEIDKK